MAMNLRLIDSGESLLDQMENQVFDLFRMINDGVDFAHQGDRAIESFLKDYYHLVDSTGFLMMQACESTLGIKDISNEFHRRYLFQKGYPSAVALSELFQLGLAEWDVKVNTVKAKPHTDRLVEILEDVSLSQRPARIVGAFYALELALLTHTKLIRVMSSRLRELRGITASDEKQAYIDRYLNLFDLPEVKNIRPSLGHFIRYHYEFDLSPIELENGASSVVLALKDWFEKSLKS